MMRKKIISPRKFLKPSFAFLIEKKRDGGEFTQEERDAMQKRAKAHAAKVKASKL